MDNGYIKIYRSLLDWEWYSDINTFKVFIHCLFKANWKDGRFRGQEIKRGSFVTGRKKLAKELKMSEREIRTALNHLKSTNEITIKTTNRYSIITVVKYSFYQDVPDDKRPTERPTTRPTSDQQATTIEEYKEYKKKEYIDISKDISRPTGAVERVINAWNALPQGIKDVSKLTTSSKRHGMLMARLKEYGEDDVLKAINMIKESDFLMSHADDWFTFEWFVRPNNFPKVLEGNYSNKKSKYDDKENSFADIAPPTGGGAWQ